MNFPLFIARRYLFSRKPDNLWKNFLALLVLALPIVAFFLVGWSGLVILGLATPFAFRYLFKNRSVNAINIITGISVGGISIGTAALILVLSVFNGFEDLLAGLFGYFHPQIMATPAKGKTFELDSTLRADLYQLPEVAYLSETLEEIAFFEYEKVQTFGIVKGVDSNYVYINGIDTTLREGSYKLFDGDLNYTVLGAGIRNKLGVNVENPLASLSIYMPIENKGLMNKPFKVRYAYPAGTFAIQQDFDNQYILTDLTFARELLGAAPNEVSALEFKLKPGASLSQAKEKIQGLLGTDFVLKDRYEQNEAFFKVMQLEKWMGFAITSLMLALMAFNMIGALWMIVLDKQKDISTLKSLGAEDKTIRQIFLLEGSLLTFLGLLIGMVLAIILYAIQKTFGIITIPQGFLVESYPISMRALDFIPVILVVLGIGALASLAPAARAVRVPAFMKEE
ncbi:MAG: FtsX-like permease family protein [Saprospiraceae bacterium]